MKTRNGFVSNSSSSSFILDLRKPKVQKYIGNIRGMPRAEGLGRGTASAVGKQAVEYAREWLDDTKGWTKDDSWNIGKWILSWAKKLGEDNVVFIRKSDEGMGGELSDYGIERSLLKLALDEMEYH